MLPPYKTIEGEEPVDLGLFGKCRVLNMAPSAENPLLLFASMDNRTN